MRNLLAGMLLLVAALLALLANVGLWIDRTIYSTDGFVSTVDKVFDDEDVQQAVAERFTETLFEQANIEPRVQEALPQGLGFLALPLTSASQDFLTRVSVRVMQEQPLEDVRNRALTGLHEQVIAVIDDDSGALSAQGDELVIDLRPILESVVEDTRLEGAAENIPEVELPEDTEQRIRDLGLPSDIEDQLLAEVAASQGEEDGGLLGGLELSDDAGQFVIKDSAVAWSYRIARYGDNFIHWVIGLAAGAFVLSVLVATDRRSMVRNVGIALIIVGTLSLVALVPVRMAAREFAQNEDAALAIINILTEPYRIQSFAMIGFGLIGVGGAVLMGQTRLAVALRGQVRRTATGAGGEGFAEAVKEHAAPLRVAGLVTGALLLVAWPDPSTRVYVTVLLLLAAYLGGVWAVSSDSERAQHVRKAVSDGWQRYFAGRPEAGEGAGGISGWIVAHAMWLRAIGVLLAVVLLLLWPSVTARSIVAVIALLLAYLAAIDFIGSRSSRPQ
jgi:hypothetical protein